jgi:V/A-type H+-transporting ATPase subunit C
MSRVGASGYAAINARVRVMYANLLTPQDYSRLYEAPDFNALVGLLSHTSYGPFLDQAKEKSLTPRRAAYQVRGRLAEAYLSIIRAAPEHAQPLLTQLYRHFEVNNLKAILRGIATHGSWDQVRYVLFPVGALSVLHPQEMMEAGNLTSAVDLLRGTPYYETVAHAMKRYTAEQNIFTLEVAIDLAYWRRLWKNVKELPSQDRLPAQKILGALVDMNNLMWAIRYRVFHHLTEEELINYTLPFGLKVKDDDIRAIAAGADYMQVAGKIFPKIAGLDLFSEEPETRLLELERHLQLNVIAQCHAAFIGNSFHIGILLAYLLLSEMEIQDLTLLFEAKGQQLPLKAFQRFLVMNNPESSQ